MDKRREDRKIRAKERKWDVDKAWLNDVWHRFWRMIGKIIKEEKNKMMYGKKETNRIDRFAYELIWWFKLVIVFLAFSYVIGR